MSGIKTILYASDLGIGSKPAFRAAIEQAKAHGAKIIYLHVIEPFDDFAEEIINDYLPKPVNRAHINKIFNEREERIRERLKAFHDEELSCIDAELVKRPSIEVLQGKADKCILKAAEKNKVDLIVMGDRVSSSLSRIFLGSTAQKVIHQSKSPVLIVPLVRTR